MAKTNASNIYIDETTKDELLEVQGGIIEAIQKGAISEQIKNKNYSGDPTSGSVTINRFANATVKAYGTARTAGAGDQLTNSGKVTINVDTDKEIVEELEKKDLKLYGIVDLARRRSANQSKRMIADLDRAFFNVVEADATLITPDGATLVERLDQLIEALETVENDWVDGVDKDMLVLTVKPAVYNAIKRYIDTIDGTTGKINMFHEVRIFSNNRQTNEALCMIEGAAGQLVTVDEYDAEKINLSNAVGLELFYSRGTASVMPDLIKGVADILTDPV